MLSVINAITHSRRPNKVAVVYSKPVIQLNSTAGNDALNPNNYKVTDDLGQNLTVVSVASSTPTTIVLTVASDHFSTRIYKLLTSNITALDGDVIFGLAQTLIGIGVGSSLTLGSGGTVTVGSAHVVFDNFDRADVGTPPGNANTGQTWIEAPSGDWGISSNELYRSTGDANSHLWIESGVSNGTIEVVKGTGGIANASWGVIFRLQDVNNFLVWNFWTGDGGFRFYKNVDGVFTGIGAGVGPSSYSPGDRFRVVCSGSSIKGYHNGVLLSDQTDATFSSQTKHGIRSTGDIGSNDRWSEFFVDL